MDTLKLHSAFEFRVVGVQGIDENSMTCASYFN